MDVVNVAARPAPPTGGGLLTLSDLLNAGRLTVVNSLDAASATVNDYVRMARATVSTLLDGGPLIAISNELEATTEVVAQDVDASSVKGAAGGLTGTVVATGTARGTDGSAQELHISGRLTVTDKCYGCVTP